MSPLEIILLYLCFRLKQVSCDYLFNNAWMANNRGKSGLAGYIPLGCHAGIHGAGTLIICLLFAPVLWWLALVDVFLHGLIDRIKAVLTDKMGWTSMNKAFWVSLGIDQEAHNLTHLGYIILIIISLGGIVL
jgi:hypothetical protein